MTVLLYLIPAALLLGLIGLGAFLWALRSGQFDDLDGAANRILFDDEDYVPPDDGGEQLCQICSSAPVVGVFSSRFGPVSHAACETCRDEGAEPLYMVCFHIHRAGGPEKAEERFAEARSFHQGRYLGLAEILGIYPEFADEFEDD